jgi:hypothetical protein
VRRELETPAHDRERPRFRIFERAPRVRADDRKAECVERPAMSPVRRATSTIVP